MPWVGLVPVTSEPYGNSGMYEDTWIGEILGPEVPSLVKVRQEELEPTAAGAKHSAYKITIDSEFLIFKVANSLPPTKYQQHYHLPCDPKPKLPFPSRRT